MSEQKTIFDRIVQWNRDRLLVQSPDKLPVQSPDELPVQSPDRFKETSFIVEELIELNTEMKSEQARPLAKFLAKAVMQPGFEPTDEQMVDALGDIIVFATGFMAKLGYDPNHVMDEVLKEIESRTGQIIDGKFVKDQNVVGYKAQFNKEGLE